VFHGVQERRGAGNALSVIADYAAWLPRPRERARGYRGRVGSMRVTYEDGRVFDLKDTDCLIVEPGMPHKAEYFTDVISIAIMLPADPMPPPDKELTQ